MKKFWKTHKEPSMMPQHLTYLTKYAYKLYFYIQKICTKKNTDDFFDQEPLNC